MLRPGLTGSPLDRADTLRNDPEALGAAMSDWRSRLLRLDGIDPVLSDTGELSWGSLAEAPETAELLLLGLLDGRAHFAALDYSMPEAAARSMAIFRSLELLPPEEASTYAAARSLIDWHLRHRFCARCGSGDTTIHRAGWGRKCSHCATEHFPRVDPVVIMLAEHDRRVLVGRQPRYPKGRYSALAGFLEPGESVEEAVARELWEEAGLKVRDVRYIVSQPWPFPSSLMMACMAYTDDPELTIDTTELDDAFWVDHHGVAASMAGELGAPFLPPPPYAIAHTLFSWWLENTGA
ncbi:NAD(+) diphosphatase [Sphingomonas sp.]|jgi:NAD+ diphosphatase|uniref:NAD(+) diphosphatase n=1 Tax=Sphingomonas sp. TaxID=28214 RepID=UPI002DE49BA7|nr:NAD(+) diphosphatase [Sphingomonas sp.]HEV2569699.1 NAD(+) diphosphatase [Sphingomonas sp.]